MVSADYSTTHSIPPESRTPCDRPRLLSTLARALDYQLVFVIGGFGYGKTALAMKLGDVMPDHRVVWYRAYHYIGSVSPEHFVATLASAIRGKCPDFGTGMATSEPIPLATTHGLDTIVQEFADEVRAKVLKPTVVVLDNFHLIDRNGQVSRFITRLIDENPPNLRFVIISRTNPAMPVPALVANGTAFMVSEAELSYTHGEIAEKLSSLGSLRHLGADGIERLASMMLEATGGYPIEVLFGGILLRFAGAGDVVGTLSGYLEAPDRLAHAQRIIFDTLPAEEREDLLALTVLDIIDFEAASHVIPAERVPGTLESLAHWRYVETLRFGDRVAYVWIPEGLRIMKACWPGGDSGERMAGYRLRAAEAYLKRNDEVSAAKQYLLAGECESGIALLASVLPRLMKALRYAEAEELLAMVPEQAFASNHTVLMAAGELERRLGRLAQAAQRFRAAAECARAFGDQAGLVEALTAFALLCMELVGVEADRERAISELEMIGTPDARLNSSLARACLKFVEEDFPASYAVALEAVSSATGAEVRYPDCLSFMISASLAWGELRDAGRFFDREVDVRKSRGEISGISDMVGIGNSLWLICLTHYAMGDLNGLEGLMKRISDGIGGADTPGAGAVLSLLGAFISLVGNDDDGALANLRACNAHVTDEKRLIAMAFNDETTFHFLKEMTELHLRRGVPAIARIYLQRLLECPLVRNGRREYRMMAAREHAEMHYVEGETGVALDIVGEALDFAVASRRQFDEVRLRILKARILYDEDRRDDAMAEVGTLLAKASSKGYAYVFVRDMARGTGLGIIGEVLGGDAFGFMDRLFVKEALAIHNPSLARRFSQSSKGAETLPARPCPERSGQKRISVGCFGPFTVTLDGQPVREWRKQRAKALMAMLLVAEGRQLPKDNIADALWPDAEPTLARGNLRNVLHALRKALQPVDSGGECPVIGSSRDSVWLDVSAIEWDLPVFAGIIDEVKCIADSLQVSAGTIENLMNKLTATYAGDFMSDSSMADLFIEKRNRYRVDFVDSLCRLGNKAIQMNELGLSQACYTRALEADDCEEQAHRGLMGVFLARGDRDAAIRQYRVCRARLRSELGVAPDHSTDKLFDCIVRVGVADRTPALRFIG